MQPLRIAHVIDSLDTGGAEVMLASLGRLQRRRGHAVRVLCLINEGALAAPLRQDGVDVYRCRHSTLLPGLRERVRLVSELRREFGAWEADVVHCHNITPVLFSGPAARLAGVGCTICTRHGFFVPRERVGAERRFWRIMRICDRAVAVSQAVADGMASFPFSRPSQIVTIPNGVIPRLPSTPPAPKTGFTLLIVSRLAHPKDHSSVLQAVALAAPRIPDLVLRIIGGGAQEAELRSLAARLGIDSRVHFMGERLDIGEWLAGADVFVLSSLSEGLPISILEAMAAGLPMILSNVGGIPDATRHLPGVRLTPPQNPAALADAILEFSARRDELPALGAAGRACFERHHSAESMTDAYLDLYAECLRGRRGFRRSG